MSEIGLRVGPFEIVAPAAVPEAGRWFVGHRVGTSSRGPAEVLLKLPDPRGPDAEDLLKEFERVREFRDPRIPEAVGYWEGAGALAVARVQGMSLADLVARPDDERLVLGPVTWTEVVCDLAETVQRAHDRRLVHGHIAGRNVWIAPDGRVWLWGLGSGPRTDADPKWNSPERALRLAATIGTDQWSLAALLLATLTGQPPGELARLSEVDARLHPILGRWPGLARVMRRMLDPSPEHRYRSVQLARTELLGQMRQIGGLSERRGLGAWVAERLGGTLVPPRRVSDEDVDDEATVLVTPDQAHELAELRQERSQASQVSRAQRADPTWPGFDPRPHDQEATMLFHDRERGDEVDTDVNKRIDEGLVEDEDSLARSMARVPVTGELREPTDEGARPLDLPIDSPTAERYQVPMLPDDDQSGPYHVALDLTEIDTAPNEASFHGPAPAGLIPRQMSGIERLATWMLAALAAAVLLWSLVRILL